MKFSQNKKRSVHVDPPFNFKTNNLHREGVFQHFRTPCFGLCHDTEADLPLGIYSTPTYLQYMWYTYSVLRDAGMFKICYPLHLIDWQTLFLVRVKCSHYILKFIWKDDERKLQFIIRSDQHPKECANIQTTSRWL